MVLSFDVNSNFLKNINNTVIMNKVFHTFLTNVFHRVNASVIRACTRSAGYSVYLYHIIYIHRF